MAEFCHVCLKEGKIKLLDSLPLCQKCYVKITNEIDNNEIKSILFDLSKKFAKLKPINPQQPVTKIFIQEI